MAADQMEGRAQPRPDVVEGEMTRHDDFAEHERTYRAFITMLQLAMLVIAVILILLAIWA